MRKLYLALIVIAAILSSLIYFSVSGIQTVSTDKKTYSSGEEVKIHWFDFSLEWCSYINEGVAIFKQETTGWKIVQHELYSFGGGFCVNGQMANFPLSSDALGCSFPRPNYESVDFSWNSKIYERKGIVNSCLNPSNNEVINITMQSYELKNAPSGKYKITFGNAQEIIEIK